MNTGDDGLSVLFGRRVALRHRIAPDDAPGPHLTDTVGELSDAGPGAVEVRTRRGTVRIRVDDVVAVRAVPAAVPRRASWAAVAHLERLCADAWPPLVVERLGEWRLRAGPAGFTRRANSTLAVGDPGVPVAAALDAVRGFAAAHGIPPLVTTTEGSPWWTAVREQGWTLSPDRGSRTIVLVAALDVLERGPVAGHADLGPPGSRAAAADVAVDGRPGPDWSAVFGEGDDDAGADERRSVLAPAGRDVGFGLARRDDGTVAGAVRAALVDDHVYLSRLRVLPGARRAGVATALTAAAARWALERGGRHAVLQVERDNAAARALYQRLGCAEHHADQYLVPSPPPGPGG